MATNMFELTDEFKLGIESVDSEHQQLIDMLNHTYQLLNNGQREQARIYFKKALTDYIDEHFANEEAMLINIKYPKLSEHAQVHKQFKLSFQRLAPKIEAGDDAAFRQALADTYTWLISHIGKTDKRYARYYFEQQGKM